MDNISGFFSMLRSFLEYLKVLQKSKSKFKCKFCGYEGKRKFSIICHKDCMQVFLNLSGKKRRKLVKRYEQNPNLCPVCHKRNKIPEENSGFMCGKCEKFNPR
jgi:peptidyl-tRNA hydrolase